MQIQCWLQCVNMENKETFFFVNVCIMNNSECQPASNNRAGLDPPAPPDDHCSSFIILNFDCITQIQHNLYLSHKKATSWETIKLS